MHWTPYKRQAVGVSQKILFREIDRESTVIFESMSKYYINHIKFFLFFSLNTVQMFGELDTI